VYTASCGTVRQVDLEAELLELGLGHLGLRLAGSALAVIIRSSSAPSILPDA
jgi:hypothetical protein